MKEKNKLGDKKFETFNNYDDVEVFYIPVREEPNIALTRIS